MTDDDAKVNLRLALAAVAMHGLTIKNGAPIAESATARIAVALADALLAELEKPKP